MIVPLVILNCFLSSSLHRFGSTSRSVVICPIVASVYRAITAAPSTVDCCRVISAGIVVSVVTLIVFM